MTEENSKLNNIVIIGNINIDEDKIGSGCVIITDPEFIKYLTTCEASIAIGANAQINPNYRTIAIGKDANSIALENDKKKK
jgi:hypothetical protein